jgi:hypothetical protein
MATINTDISQKIDIIIRENNSSVINLTISDSSGSPFNLTGYATTLRVYDSSNVTIFELNNDVGLSSGIGNTVGGSGTLDSTGKISINISTITSSANPGTYKYKFVLSKGITNQTWLYGKFKINEDN